jgi:hypothetical protein
LIEERKVRKRLLTLAAVVGGLCVCGSHAAIVGTQFDSTTGFNEGQLGLTTIVGDFAI